MIAVYSNTKQALPFMTECLIAISHFFKNNGWYLKIILLSCCYAFQHSLKKYPEFRKKWHVRSEEHTSEVQSRPHLVCRLLLEKKNAIRPAGGGDRTGHHGVRGEQGCAHREQAIAIVAHPGPTEVAGPVADELAGRAGLRSDGL